VNHTSLVASEEALTLELEWTRNALVEVASENQILVNENNALRDEVLRLQAVLASREEQFFSVTGKNPDEEQF
jgi:hypothetical protein